MVEVNAKYLDNDWANTLQTGKEPSISDLAKLVFGLSASDKLCDDKDEISSISTRKRQHVLLY